MFGGGDQRRMSIDGEPPPNTPLSINKALVLADPSVQNGMHSPQMESVINNSKKIQDNLQELGHKIKHHEDNVKYLKALTNKLEDSILDMQVTLGKYYSSLSAKEDENAPQGKSEEEIIENIMKHEKTAAALFYRLKSQPEAQFSDNSLLKDVLGIVATLGKVNDDKLSRMLSEFLGLDSMLTMVCKTYEGVKTLETYNEDGSVNRNLGLHALAASTGKPIGDRFNIICIENLRPYSGALKADDPQRMLDLIKPKLANGESPPGFLGFAVNMINIEPTNLYCGVPNTGHSLRETLFYHLFRSVQVYKTRKDMLKARYLMPDGAISLDGGIIKSSGEISLGVSSDADVMFPIGSKTLNFPDDRYFETENRMKETKWKKERAKEDMQRELEQLNHAKFSFETKKKEFVDSLAQSSFYASQVGRAPTPR